ncbi:MAG: hypothetical protein U0169_05250 [Polyangiaceae bacterium]
MEAATKKKWIRRIVAALFVIVVVVPAAYTWFSLTFVYSSGERVGFVQKISKRGWVCKTFEGDLAMVNMPGQPAAMFSFSVRDAKVVDQIEALAGHKVSLQYEEHSGVPSTCFGDTPYFVTGVRKAD